LAIDWIGDWFILKGLIFGNQSQFHRLFLSLDFLFQIILLHELNRSLRYF